MRTLKELIGLSGEQDSKWFRKLCVALEANPKLAQCAAKLLAVEAELKDNLAVDDPFFPPPGDEEAGGEIVLGEVVRVGDL